MQVTVEPPPDELAYAQTQHDRDVTQTRWREVFEVPDVTFTTGITTSALDAVAELLGNTPAICRKCYVHPAIVETYLSREQIAVLNGSKMRTTVYLRAAERGVLRFLRTRNSRK